MSGYVNRLVCSISGFYDNKAVGSAHGSLKRVAGRSILQFYIPPVFCEVTASEAIMGKKKAGGGAVLGRALIKERLQAGRGNKRGDSWV